MCNSLSMTIVTGSLWRCSILSNSNYLLVCRVPNTRNGTNVHYTLRTIRVHLVKHNSCHLQHAHTTVVCLNNWVAHRALLQCNRKYWYIPIIHTLAGLAMEQILWDHSLQIWWSVCMTWWRYKEQLFWQSYSLVFILHFASNVLRPCGIIISWCWCCYNRAWLI